MTNEYGITQQKAEQIDEMEAVDLIEYMKNLVVARTTAEAGNARNPFLDLMDGHIEYVMETIESRMI